MIDPADIDDETPEEPSRGRNDPNDVATNGEIRRSEELRSDDVAAWTVRCAPVVKLLRTKGPMRMQRIKAHLKHLVGAKLTEECVFWLERQGAVVSFLSFSSGQRMYRISVESDKIANEAESMGPQPPRRPQRTSIGEVRALVRLVESGEMKRADAWSKLRKLVGV